MTIKPSAHLLMLELASWVSGVVAVMIGKLHAPVLEIGQVDGVGYGDVVGRPIKYDPRLLAFLGRIFFRGLLSLFVFSLLRYLIRVFVKVRGSLPASLLGRPGARGSFFLGEIPWILIHFMALVLALLSRPRRYLPLFRQQNPRFVEIFVNKFKLLLAELMKLLNNLAALRPSSLWVPLL